MLVDTESDAILISPVGAPGEQEMIGNRPTVLVAPSLLHAKHLMPARTHFLTRAVWGPLGFGDKHPEHAGAKVFGVDPWPYGHVLPFVAVEGAPKRNEVVFFHPASRTLYTADLVFAISEPKGFLAPLAFRAMGVHKRFAMAKPWQHWVKDRPAFRRSMEEILAWDFDRIAMAHGDIVGTGGRELLIAALRERDLL